MDPKGTPWCLCGAKATPMQWWSRCWQSPPASEKMSRSGAICTRHHLAMGPRKTMVAARPRTQIRSQETKAGYWLRVTLRDALPPVLVWLPVSPGLTHTALGDVRFRFSPSSLSPLTLTSYSPPLCILHPLLYVSKRFISPVYLFYTALGKPPRAGGFVCLLTTVLPVPTQGQHTVTMVVTVPCCEGCAVSDPGGIFKMPI